MSVCGRTSTLRTVTGLGQLYEAGTRIRGARAGTGGGRRFCSVVCRVLRGEEVQDDVVEDVVVGWLMGLRLLSSLPSFSTLLPMLLAPDEGEEDEGEVEEEDWEHAKGPSHTSLIRLFRISKFRAGPLLGPSLPMFSSTGQRGTLRAGGVLIWHWSISPGGTRGLRMMGALTGACLFRATC